MQVPPFTTPVQVVFLNAPVEQLLLEGQRAHLPQEPELADPQEGQDRPERPRVAVEEELVARHIVIVADVQNVVKVSAELELSQACQGELVERGPGQQVLDAPHVDDDVTLAVVGVEAFEEILLRVD